MMIRTISVIIGFVSALLILTSSSSSSFSRNNLWVMLYLMTGTGLILAFATLIYMRYYCCIRCDRLTYSYVYRFWILIFKIRYFQMLERLDDNKKIVKKMLILVQTTTAHFNNYSSSHAESSSSSTSNNHHNMSCGMRSKLGSHCQKIFHDLRCMTHLLQNTIYNPFIRSLEAESEGSICQLPEDTFDNLLSEKRLLSDHQLKCLIQLNRLQLSEFLRKIEMIQIIANHQPKG